MRLFLESFAEMKNRFLNREKPFFEFEKLKGLCLIISLGMEGWFAKGLEIFCNQTIVGASKVLQQLVNEE